MTPAEKLGFKIGESYVLVETNYNSHLTAGQVLEFLEDDNSSIPYFKVIGGEISAYGVGDKVCVDLRDLKLYNPHESLDKPREILDTNTILKKYISTKYGNDSFLKFLVDSL